MQTPRTHLRQAPPYHPISPTEFMYAYIPDLYTAESTLEAYNLITQLLYTLLYVG